MVIAEEKKSKVTIPPIKCQGIKTKLIPFIKDSLLDINYSTWIEPFLGSGVVAFNILPQNAILSDKNIHIINLYTAIQDGTITKKEVREFLEYHGNQLKTTGEEYYKKMRSDFNINFDPLYFLFLNRSDFNGMIRFNKKGNFNVPFCKKNERFSKSYITKICNQVEKVSEIIKIRNWKFICCDWKETFKMAKSNDLIYIDPPYIGRDTSYIGEWPEEEAIQLASYAHNTTAKVLLSMWKENKYRKNEHLFDFWNDFNIIEKEHFYHIGAKEVNRNPITEVLAKNF